MEQELGRVLAAPGSKASDRAPTGLAASRVDPSRMSEIERLLEIMRGAAKDYRQQGYHYGSEPKGWPKSTVRAWAAAGHGKADALEKWAEMFSSGWHNTEEAFAAMMQARATEQTERAEGANDLP